MFPETVRNVAYHSVVGCKIGLAGEHLNILLLLDWNSISHLTALPSIIANANSDYKDKPRYFVLGLFSFSKSAAWIFFSSSTLLFAPLLMEIERTQMQAAQLNQQKQVNHSEYRCCNILLWLHLLVMWNDYLLDSTCVFSLLHIKYIDIHGMTYVVGNWNCVEFEMTNWK